MPDPMLPTRACAVSIPELNEAGNIRQLAEGVARTVALQVIVVANGLTDAAGAEAAAAGALVAAWFRREERDETRNCSEEEPYDQPCRFSHPAR